MLKVLSTFAILGVSILQANIDDENLKKGCLKLSCDYIGEVYLKEHNKRIYKRIGDCRVKFKTFYLEPNNYDIKVISVHNNKHWVYQEQNILLEKPQIIKPKKKVQVVVSSDLKEKVEENKVKIIQKCNEVIAYKRKDFKLLDEKVVELDKRFIANKDYVDDTVLGIKWQDTVDNKSKKLDYQSALNYCSDMGWRLPTALEMKSLSSSEIFSYNGKDKLSDKQMDIFVNVPANKDYWVAPKTYAMGEKDYFVYNNSTSIKKPVLSFQKYHTRCVVDN